MNRTSTSPHPPHAMTDTNVKTTCKYHTKLQSAANTTRNRAQTLKNSGVVNDAASINNAHTIDNDSRVKQRSLGPSESVSSVRLLATRNSPPFNCCCGDEGQGSFSIWLLSRWYRNLLVWSCMVLPWRQLFRQQQFLRRICDGEVEDLHGLRLLSSRQLGLKVLQHLK